MALTINNDTSYHEAGHCFIAYLASDFFELEFVTANVTVAKKQDVTSLGGIKGKLIKEGESLNTEEYDLMVLMSLAGMAADDINHTNGIIHDRLYDNKTWSDKLNSKKYSGDREVMMPSLQRLDPRWLVSQREYTLSCQKLLHELFTTDPIKTMVLGLRNLIDNAKNKTVSGKDIFDFLESKGLIDWKDKNWPRISDQRSKMFK